MARRKFLQYVYEKIIQVQEGYSFSIPHTLAYSIEALQEANLAILYNHLFWPCACLSVNAGSSGTTMAEDYEDGDSKEGEEGADDTVGSGKTATVNYGKVSRAIADIQRQGVTVVPPDVNKADYDFTPDIENNAILFALPAVTTINSDIVARIIEARKSEPFAKLSDFIARVNPTNLQMINLIKAGAFDAIYPTANRRAIMRLYLENYAKANVTRKEKLTSVHLQKLIDLDVLPQEYASAKRIMNFKKFADKEQLLKDEKRYRFDAEPAAKFFDEVYVKGLTLGKDYDIIPLSYKGYMRIGHGFSIKQSTFTRVTNKLLAPVKEWLSTPQASDLFYEAEVGAYVQNIESKYTQGTISHWEMESLHYYYHEHELARVNTAKYDIRDFDSLPEFARPIATKTNKKGAEYDVYDVCSIAGTVINSDNNRHIVTLLTHNGKVVDVKFYDMAYIHYNKIISTVDEKGKKQSIEKSWFTRGNLLLVSGIRRELSFVPKTDWDSGHKFAVQLIEKVNLDGSLVLKTHRETVN